MLFLLGGCCIERAVPYTKRSRLHCCRDSLAALQVLRNFAYRTLVLFLLGGSVLAWLLVNWARGSALQLSNPYVFNVTFPVGKL